MLELELLPLGLEDDEPLLLELGELALLDDSDELLEWELSLDCDELLPLGLEDDERPLLLELDEGEALDDT